MQGEVNVIAQAGISILKGSRQEWRNDFGGGYNASHLRMAGVV